MCSYAHSHTSIKSEQTWKRGRWKCGSGNIGTIYPLPHFPLPHFQSPLEIPTVVDQLIWMGVYKRSARVRVCGELHNYRQLGIPLQLLSPSKSSWSPVWVGLHLAITRWRWFNSLSVIFHPCSFCPSFSSPAFSCPANSVAPLTYCWTRAPQSIATPLCRVAFLCSA